MLVSIIVLKSSLHFLPLIAIEQDAQAIAEFGSNEFNISHCSWNSKIHTSIFIYFV